MLDVLSVRRLLVDDEDIHVMLSQVFGEHTLIMHWGFKHDSVRGPLGIKVNMTKMTSRPPVPSPQFTKSNPSSTLIDSM